MHILQPSTLFRRQVSKQVQQLPAQEYTNQQKTASGPLKHELQEHKLVIKQGSKQVQVQMQEYTS